MKVADIQKVIKEELQKFGPYFREQMQSPVSTLSAVTNYVYRRKGKQLRPLIVFLSAKLNGTINERTYVGATMVELLHSATLMHDDVVDEAFERRGTFSVNALWRSKTAVLAGDFLLSRGLLIALEKGSEDLLKIISDAIRYMSEGELQQMEKAQVLDTSEDTYFDIINKKTASLIKSCATIGAISVGASEEHVLQMSSFGHQLGVAFQLRDDVLDYHKSGLTGKTSGNDIKEKKITLPLIHALNQVNRKEQNRIVSLIQNAKNNPKNIGLVMNFVEEKGGIDYANKITNDFCVHAKESLKEYPDSEVKTALLSLVDYVKLREK
ncbi:MAG: polyprenyl synthetase family protein [Prevotellaceae bacterium]|jgi:octaprenyl-diphosphate synthase|nr:polyprenyl synthetase family protein [Prevotellaceae bacterium]